MIYPCKKCTHDTGKCRCLDWQRWFSVEFEAEAAKVLAATHAEPLPAPPKIFYLDAYQYKELVSRSTKLEMLERAYKELKSYEVDAILKTIFGEKEEAC